MCWMSVHGLSLKHRWSCGSSSKQLIDFGFQRFFLKKNVKLAYLFYPQTNFKINKQTIMIEIILCSPSHSALHPHSLLVILVSPKNPEKQKLLNQMFLIFSPFFLLLDLDFSWYLWLLQDACKSSNFRLIVEQERFLCFVIGWVFVTDVSFEQQLDVHFV